MQTLRLHVLYNQSFCRSKFHTAVIGIFDLFGAYDLDQMTFIYELDPCPLEIYVMCENELPTSRILKVYRQTYIQTERQIHTDRETDIHTYEQTDIHHQYHAT